jgi:hypothetical protein
MQQTAAIGGRTLGENRDMLAAGQDFADLGIDHPGVAATAATQEDGVVPGRQPADQWPLADLGLGHEGGRQRRIDHVDVDPGNVIGDQQSPRHGMGQVGLDLDSQGVEQGDRPARLEAQAGRRAAQRIDQQGGEKRGDQQQGDAEQSVAAEQEVGLVQTVYPR